MKIVISSNKDIIKPQLISTLKSTDIDLYLLKEYLERALERHNILVDDIKINRQDSTLYIGIKFFVLGAFKSSQMKSNVITSKYFKFSNLSNNAYSKISNKFSARKGSNLRYSMFKSLNLKPSELSKIKSAFITNVEETFDSRKVQSVKKNIPLAKLLQADAVGSISDLIDNRRRSFMKKSFKKVLNLAKKFNQQRFFEDLIKEYLRANSLKNWVLMLNLEPLHKVITPVSYSFEEHNEEIFGEQVRKYMDKIFSRKAIHAKMDFQNICLLFAQGKVSANLFFEVVVTAFKYLYKRKHSMFFKFIKSVFEAILQLNFNVLAGLDIKISGKIGGKTMASTKKIFAGVVWNDNSLRLNKSATNKIGTFGFTLVVYKLPRFPTQDILYAYSSQYLSQTDYINADIVSDSEKKGAYLNIPKLQPYTSRHLSRLYNKFNNLTYLSYLPYYNEKNCKEQEFGVNVSEKFGNSLQFRSLFSLQLPSKTEFIVDKNTFFEVEKNVSNTLDSSKEESFDENFYEDSVEDSIDSENETN